MRKKFCKALAWRLRCFADRIDRDGAVAMLSTHCFRFVRNKGIVIDEKRVGCRLWYFIGEYNDAFNGKDYFND